MNIVPNVWVSPDRAASAYVCDLLNHCFGLGLSPTVPGVTACVLSTLDWMRVCGTWIWEQTGLINFEDKYSFTLYYAQTVMDPQEYAIFGYDASLEDVRFNGRLTEPGLTDFERRECVSFVRNVGLAAWVRQARREGRESYVIDAGIVEYVVWATIVWSLSPNGREWLQQADQLLDHTIENPPKTYWSNTSQAILDPAEVRIDASRPVGTCMTCGNSLYCVKPRIIVHEATDDLPAVFPLCLSCYVGAAREFVEDQRKTGAIINVADQDLAMPACPHQAGCGKYNTWKGGNCSAVCPHSGVTVGSQWEKLHAVGAARARAYGEAILAGATPAPLEGMTTGGLEEIFGANY